MTEPEYVYADNLTRDLGHQDTAGFRLNRTVALQTHLVILAVDAQCFDGQPRSVLRGPSLGLRAQHPDDCGHDHECCNDREAA